TAEADSTRVALGLTSYDGLVLRGRLLCGACLGRYSAAKQRLCGGEQSGASSFAGSRGIPKLNCHALQIGERRAVESASASTGQGGHHTRQQCLRFASWLHPQLGVECLRAGTVLLECDAWLVICKIKGDQLAMDVLPQWIAGQNAPCGGNGRRMFALTRVM